MSIFTRVFWKDTAERAIKTGAQTVAASWAAAGVSTVVGLDWRLAGGTAAFATLFSVLMSIGSGAITQTQGASLVVEAIDPPGKHAADI